MKGIKPERKPICTDLKGRARCRERERISRRLLGDLADLAATSSSSVGGRVELPPRLAGENFAVAGGASHAEGSLDGGAVLALARRDCRKERKNISQLCSICLIRVQPVLARRRAPFAGGAAPGPREGGQENSPHPPQLSRELSVSMHSYVPMRGKL